MFVHGLCNLADLNQCVCVNGSKTHTSGRWLTSVAVNCFTLTSYSTFIKGLKTKQRYWSICLLSAQFGFKFTTLIILLFSDVTGLEHTHTHVARSSLWPVDLSCSVGLSTVWFGGISFTQDVCGEKKQPLKKQLMYNLHLVWILETWTMCGDTPCTQLNSFVEECCTVLVHDSRWPQAPLYVSSVKNINIEGGQLSAWWSEVWRQYRQM